MSLQEFPVLGYAPDLPRDTPGVIAFSSRIIPTVRGIANGYGLTATTDDVNSAILGAAKMTLLDGSDRAYVGTATKLYEYAFGSGLTDRSDTAYTATSWSFTQVGSVTLAACTGNIIRQSTGAAFSALGVAPVPKAGIICTVGPPSSYQVMAFDYDDGTNHYVDGWYCSALGNYLDWTPALATQCANGRIIDTAGPFTAAIAYRDGVIAFKAHAMYEGTYVGDTTSGVIWSWRRIAADIGCQSRNMVCTAGDVIYFADRRGIWMYDGSYPKKVPGYIHDAWAQVIQNLNTSTIEQKQVYWDADTHCLFVSYNTGIDATLHYLVWSSLSQLWTLHGAIQTDSAGNDVAMLIGRKYNQPSGGIYVAARATTDATGLIQQSATQTASITFGHYGRHGEQNYLDRIAPSWTQGTASVNAASTASVGMYKSAFSSIGSTSAQTIDSDTRYFDVRAEAPLVQPVLSLIGQWEFGKLGLSLRPGGKRG